MEGLVGLLNINEEYGLRRDVDPVLVLAGFLGEFWPGATANERDRLSLYLLDHTPEEEIKTRVKVGSYKNKDNHLKSLKRFLRQMLWSKPIYVEERWEATKAKMVQKRKEKEKILKNFLKAITYHPLNHWLVGNVGANLQLGTNLAKILCFATADKSEIIKARIHSLEQHVEAEEQIVKTLLQLEDSSHNKPTSKKRSTGGKDTFDPRKFQTTNYASLFEQMAEDLIAFLALDFKLLAKSRLLLYLERLINLYALLYYLRIICRHKDKPDGSPPDGDHPLIIPLCSTLADDTFKAVSTNCFQLYRQKAENFWREHIQERIQKNADTLNCGHLPALTIINEFIKHNTDRVIFGYSMTTAREKEFKKEIMENLEELNGFYESPIEQLTEAFLSYNLKGFRTLSRMKWFFDRQGPGAGIVAPQTGLGKHFNLQSELLEVLVIIFANRLRGKPHFLTLGNFVREMRIRYGIILGYEPDLEATLAKQGIPSLPGYLLRKNFTNVTTMLKNQNMLENLSDKTNYIRCPFAFRQEEA